MNEYENHNPDVLSCLASLSNDEVFTPPNVANEMLDCLPQSIWSNPNVKILDPCCKSGIFLREAAKRFIAGLKDVYPDLQERINHICKEQLYGIAITELTSLLSRRSLYCSKYANGEYSICTGDFTEMGQILFEPTRHSWLGKNCRFCGANKDNYDRPDDLEAHAYSFIHTINPEEIFHMKFDVIIGNPPYQLSDGGQAASAKPIYQHFVNQALKLNPQYLVMIVPARWYAGGKGLDQFREKMLNDSHIKVLCDFAKSSDCFPGVNIAGGVCYFLWDKSYSGDCEIFNVKDNMIFSTKTRPLDEYKMFVRSNDAIDIIHKIKSKSSKFVDSYCKSYSYFCIRSFERGQKDIHNKSDVILLSSKGKGYYPVNKVVDKDKILGKYKTIITYAMSGGNKPSSTGDYQVVSSLQVLYPNEVCTETYLVLGVFDTEVEAKNMCTYVSTKFFRYLLLQALTSIHITKESFCFVPWIDYSNAVSDKELYDKYALNQEQINLIESTIKDWKEGVEDDD